MVYNCDTQAGNIRWYEKHGVMGPPVECLKIYGFLTGKTVGLFGNQPQIRLVMSDPYAVRYAIETLFPDATFAGGWPPLTDLYDDGPVGTIY